MLFFTFYMIFNLSPFFVTMQSKHSVALDRIKTRWCPRLSNKSAIIGCLAASGHRVSHSEPIISHSTEPISEGGVGQVPLQRHVGGHSGSLLPGTVLCCTVGWCQYWIFPVQCCLILILNSNKVSFIFIFLKISLLLDMRNLWIFQTRCMFGKCSFLYFRVRGHLSKLLKVECHVI